MKSNEEFIKGIYEKANARLDMEKKNRKKSYNWKRPALLLCASITLIVSGIIYRNTLTSNQSSHSPQTVQFTRERANISGNNNFSTTTLPMEILVEGKLFNIQYTTTSCSFTLQVTYSPDNIPSTIHLQINLDILSSIYPNKLEENIPTSLLLSYSNDTFSVTSIVQ